MTSYDRYLAWNYFTTFVILFATTFGLFVVGDLVDNVDDFTIHGGSKETVDILSRIVVYYSYQGLFFLNFIGQPLILLSMGVAMLVIRRRKEFTPLLAAGIPVFRLLVPFIAVAIFIDGLLVINREIVVPRIAHHKHENRGKQGDTRHSAQAAYDYSSGVLIQGGQLNLNNRTLIDAEFVLPVPTLASELTVLKTPSAVFYPKSGEKPAGWLLKEPKPSYEELRLTEAGHQIISPIQGSPGVFVKTPVDCNMLYGKGGSASLLSTKELLARVQNPAFNSRPLRSYTLETHGRLVGPLMTVANALIVFIFMFRRESRGLVMDVWLGLVALATVFGVEQLLLFVGNTGLIEASLAAWVPFAYTGLIVSWNIDSVQT